GLPYDPHASIPVQVEQSFLSSLTHLCTDRIDSYLLHGPTRRVGLAPADWQAWRAMEAIHDSPAGGPTGRRRSGLAATGDGGYCCRGEACVPRIAAPFCPSPRALCLPNSFTAPTP